jgi:PAS domain S-box-containing protein
MTSRASDFASTVGDDRAVAVLDASGRFTYVGPAIERLTGYPAQRFTEADPFELIHPEDRDSVMQLLECSLMALEVEMSGRFRIVCPDGEARWFELHCLNLVRDPSVGGVLVHLHDISDQQ